MLITQSTRYLLIPISRSVKPSKLRLYEGDKVVLRAAYYDEKEILDLLKGIAGDDVEMEKE